MVPKQLYLAQSPHIDRILELGTLELGTKLTELGTKVTGLGTKVTELGTKTFGALLRDLWTVGMPQKWPRIWSGHYATHPQVCQLVPILRVSLWEISSKEVPSSVAHVLG